MSKINNKEVVLYITHGFPPESYGGVEVYLSNLFNEFKKSNEFYPVVLTRTTSNKNLPGIIYTDEKDPQKFYINTPETDLFKLKNEFTDDFFKEFLLNLKPSIVHFQHYLHLSLTWFEVVKKTLPDAKIVFTTHEYLSICPNSGQMIKTHWQNFKLCDKPSVNDCAKCFPYLNKSVFKERTHEVKKYLSYIDLFTGPSNFIKSRYVEFGISKNKYIASENGQNIFEAVKPQNRTDKKLKLVYIGQINNFKGIQILLEAMNLLKDNKDITLDIHGKFQNMPDFVAKMTETINNLDKVNFHGPYSQDKLPEILSSYDVLIVPSIWWENSPLVIQEGFMAKLPIICSDIGGMAEKVQNNINGLHFKTGNSKDLAEIIKKLNNNRELLSKLKAGIPKVKSIEDNKKELEKIYRQIIK